MSSLTKLLSTTAVVKRYTAVGGVRTGSTETLIAALPITPLTSIDYNTAQRVSTTHRPMLQSPYKFKMVLFEGDRDIKQGDFMVIDGINLAVRHIEQWPYITPNEKRMVAILESEVR